MCSHNPVPWQQQGGFLQAASRSWSGNFPECHRTTRGHLTETEGQQGHEDDEAFRHYFEAQWCTGSELALTMGTRSSF